jgi:hypothetical protein
LIDPVKFYDKHPRPDVLQYGFDKELSFDEYERSLGTNSSVKTEKEEA